MRRLGALGPRPAALPALVVLAALAAVAALATVKSFDGDLGFHLATGRAVLALGRVPSTNVLAYTQPEHPWVLQQWLPATLFELAWRAWGAAGPLGVKVAVVVASFACALAAARRLGAATAVAAPVAVLGAWAAAFRFSERPLVFSNLAVAALALVLAGAASSPRRRARLALAAVIVAVACHLHAGAVFLFVLLAATGAGLVVEPLRRRWLKDDHAEGPAGWRPALALAGVAVAGLALAGATLALYHPYGLRVLEVPFTMAGDAYLAEHLVEFRAPWRFPVAYLGAYWALLLAATALVLARVRAVPATWSAPVAAFALLSLRHVRLVDVFALVAVPPVAAALTALAARAGEARA